MVSGYRWGRVAFAAIVFATLGGCGDANDNGAAHPSPSSSVTVTPTPTSSATPTSTPTPVPAELAGVYDVVAFSDREPSHMVAAVFADNAGTLFMSINIDSETSFSVQGTFRDDGSLALEGFAIVSSDIGVSVTGTATVTTDASHRIVGSVTSRSDVDFPRFDAAFTLERARGASSERFTGRYEFHIDPSASGCDCESAMVLDLLVAPDGLGNFQGGNFENEIDDVASDATRVGTLEPGFCHVSPTGGLFCGGLYTRHIMPLPDGPSIFFINVRGRLQSSASGIVGTGTIDSNPLFGGHFDDLSWQATSLPNR